MDSLFLYVFGDEFLNVKLNMDGGDQNISSNFIHRSKCSFVSGESVILTKGCVRASVPLLLQC